MDDIEMREAQLVFVGLQSRWDADKNPRLMRELDVAERRLIVLFSTEWEKRGGDRRTINLAYSHYRKRLMRQFGLREAPYADTCR
jgi:nuclear transport factor 2 (NTF2) superfamily protein